MVLRDRRGLNDRRIHAMLGGAYMRCCRCDVLVEIHDYVLVKVHGQVLVEIQDEVLVIM